MYVGLTELGTSLSMRTVQCPRVYVCHYLLTWYLEYWIWATMRRRFRCTHWCTDWCTSKLISCLFQIEAALAVDAINVIQLTLSTLIANDTSIFKHTFRRGDVYNYNRSKGVPCDTEPPVPWMHGVALMEGMKRVITHFI